MYKIISVLYAMQVLTTLQYVFCFVEPYRDGWHDSGATLNPANCRIYLLSGRRLDTCTRQVCGFLCPDIQLWLMPGVFPCLSLGSCNTDSAHTLWWGLGL